MSTSPLAGTPPVKETRRKRATTSPDQPAAEAITPLPAVGPRRIVVIEPGWYDLAEEDYHADPCPEPSLSASIAKLVVGKSLLHAWRGHPRSPVFDPAVMGQSADRGSAAHAMLFGGRMIEPIPFEDFRTTTAREARDNARASGRIPILARDIKALSEMIDAARDRFYHLHGGSFLCEQTAIWQGDGGGWRRARLDTVSLENGLVVDYKTTEGAVDALSCERRIADMGLQIQAAAYVAALEALHPELQGRVKFVFQWQEQKPPFALSPPIEMSEAFMSLGRAQWQAAGQLWDQASKHRAFPGYSTRPHLACPPPWELSRWEERALTENFVSGGVQ